MIRIFLILLYSAKCLSSMMAAPSGMTDMRCMVNPSSLAASSMPTGLCGGASSLPPTMPIVGSQCPPNVAFCPSQMNNNYHCIHCNTFNYQMPNFNIINNNTPWYHSYSRMRWPNYNRPAVWNNGYADHHFYPGPGNVAVGKPNVYIHGTLLGKQRLQVQMKNGSNLLAASPVHDKDGWVFEKDKSHLKVYDATYSYFYYDFKTHEKYLQNKAGFCGDKNTLYQRMISILKEMGFKKKEITDFEDYWAVKYPGGKYCVYPQTHAELQQLAQWNASFMPAKFKRVIFVSVPNKENHKIITKHFLKKPEKDWNPQKGIYRVPASKNDIAIHEWGVAFLTNKK